MIVTDSHSIMRSRTDPSCNAYDAPRCFRYPNNSHPPCRIVGSRLPGGIESIEPRGADVVLAEGSTRRKHFVGVVATLRPLVEDRLPHEAAATRKTRERLIVARVIPERQKKVV